MRILTNLFAMLTIVVPAAVIGTSDDTARGYHAFVEQWITFDGRIQRPLEDFDSASDSQAYAMLLAAWNNDQTTFDEVYRWTLSHLSRQGAYGDHRLAWRWNDGKVADWTPATDADTDYAYALLLAQDKWQTPSMEVLPPYGEQAKRVLTDVMEQASAESYWGRVLLPGPWAEKRDGSLVYNPSYFSPSWYRKFAKETGDARWAELVDTGYKLLARMQEKLGYDEGVGLVPDWCRLWPDGLISADRELSPNSSWEAFKTTWRVADDWYVYGTPEAKRFLEKQRLFFDRQLREAGKLALTYSYKGEALEEASPAIAYVPLYCTACLADNTHDASMAYTKLLHNVGMKERSSSESAYTTAWQLLTVSNPSMEKLGSR